MVLIPIFINLWKQKQWQWEMENIYTKEKEGNEQSECNERNMFFTI